MHVSEEEKASMQLVQPKVPKARRKAAAGPNPLAVKPKSKVEKPTGQQSGHRKVRRKRA